MKRKVHLTERLAQGFKLAGINVSPREEEDEEQLIREIEERQHLETGGTTRLSLGDENP